MIRINSNMGIGDQLIRIAFSAIIIAMYFNKEISGIAAVILLIFAGILLITSSISFCPIYALFRISTKKKKLSK